MENYVEFGDGFPTRLLDGAALDNRAERVTFSLRLLSSGGEKV